MVAMSASKILARSVPASVQAVVVINPYENVDDALLSKPNGAQASTYENHIRLRRAYDPYAQYYYYPSSLNPADRYESESPRTKKNSSVNRRQSEDDLITQDGNKYKYTPLFQYKSTQSRRRKLFVPNLFG